MGRIWYFVMEAAYLYISKTMFSVSDIFFFLPFIYFPETLKVSNYLFFSICSHSRKRRPTVYPVKKKLLVYINPLN